MDAQTDRWVRSQKATKFKGDYSGMLGAVSPSWSLTGSLTDLSWKSRPPALASASKAFWNLTPAYLAKLFACLFPTPTP